ncbi:phosphopantetheine-binding protein [Nonomuraea sp. NPDC000554]|uniref:phosphopantetheine-binding protein n=1 Tax=Nonomuraea sp. NPDC000554 TaxID=3154259 RepID=UPI00332CE58D
MAGNDQLSYPELCQHITEVWRDILHLDRIEPDQDFFDLGGHSLGAMRAAARLADDLGCDLSLRAIFEHRTIEALALAITNIGAST